MTITKEEMQVKISLCKELLKNMEEGILQAKLLYSKDPTINRFYQLINLQANREELQYSLKYFERKLKQL